MARILHILPHPGGGGETVVDMLTGLTEHEHGRLHLTNARTPLKAAPGLATGVPRARRAARGADLIHVVGDMAAVLMLPVLRRSPSVFATHGLHFLRRGGTPAQRALRAVVAAADRTACSSPSERDELAALVAPSIEARLVVTPNGVPLSGSPTSEEREAARGALGLAPCDVVGLYLGHLEERKEPLVAAEAAEAVARRGLPFVLLVAGEGPQMREFRTRSHPAVRALGFRSDRGRLLAAADLFVLPSSREGLSLALLEAMAHGLPCVVADVPGNTDGIGDAGLKHPVGDAAALADLLGHLTRDPTERVRLGAAARARHEDRFTLERFLTDMRLVFAEVLAARAPAPTGDGALA